MKLTPQEKRIVLIGMRITAFAIILAFVVYHLPEIWKMIQFLMNVATPFLYGLGIAFIVNMPMRRIESVISRLPIGKKASRTISMLLAYALIFSFVTLTLTYILPKVVESISRFIPLIPGLLRDARSFIQNATWLGNYRDPINQYINGLIKNINTLTLQQFINTYFEGINLKELLSQVATNVFSQVGSIFGVAFSSLVSFIFSIYALSGKESLSQRTKKLIYTFLSEKQADGFMYVAYTAFDNFYNFFTGQFLEAILLAIMNYIGMTILGFDYALVISMLTLIGALIPMVGAFLAGLVGAFMLMTNSLTAALSYLIYVTVLQQLEGNIVYPRVVGQQTGLPSMLVLLAVLIGASVSGFFGMLFFVPMTATVYTILVDYMDRKMAEKNLSIETK